MSQELYVRVYTYIKLHLSRDIVRCKSIFNLPYHLWLCYKSVLTCNYYFVCYFVLCLSKFVYCAYYFGFVYVQNVRRYFAWSQLLVPSRLVANLIHTKKITSSLPRCLSEILRLLCSCIVELLWGNYYRTRLLKWHNSLQIHDKCSNKQIVRKHAEDTCLLYPYEKTVVHRLCDSVLEARLFLKLVPSWGCG